MKLKQLEIIGFKSFAERTLLTFEKDITAIVGPNGCGKSNVVDAIRWVMGEQSAKHLRGKSMEDVIFSGSTNRPPLSMASVELTFSTEGYQTPPQYSNLSEISICRRLYRDGTSEYFINKSPSRLKDITDLFLGTGIGTKAYSIIEQGRVGQIISAKPEDRRFLIEEVAGISKFKFRREEARRKMESTEQNMLRLTDIIQELERQMRSLDRQAKKAEKYKEVKTEFEKLDLSLSSTLYGRDNAIQLQLEEELRVKGAQELDQKSRLTLEENQIEEIKIQLTEREKEIQRLQNELFETTNTLRLTENSIRFKNEESTELASRKISLEGEMAQLNVKIAEAQIQLDQISERKLMADFEEEKFKEELHIHGEELIQATNALSSLKVDLDAKRELVFSKETRLSQISTLKQNLENRRQELEKRVEEDQKELSQSQNQYVQVQKIYNEATQSLGSLKQLKLDLTVKTDNLSGELKSHRENLRAQEKELAALKETITLKKSRLHSLEELHRNFEGYGEGTRSILLKRHELGDGGIFGAVADYVETDPQYEGAVSAVLGEKLQYVVVKSQKEGVEAVEYLRIATQGRSTFIPMALKSRAPSENVIEGEGVLGPLSRFVRVKEDISSLKDFLFGDVVVVESLQKALDVWAASSPEQTFVTLSGEVVAPSGVITGGTPENTSQALLEKKREMKDLSSLIHSLEETLTQKQNECTQLTEQVKQLESLLDSVRHSSHAEEINLVNQEKDVISFRREMEYLEGKKTTLSTRLNEATRALEEITPKLASLEGEGETLEFALEEDRASLTYFRESLTGLETDFQDKSKRHTEIKIQLAEAQQKNSYLNQDIKRLEELKLDLRVTIADRENAREVCVNRTQALAAEVEHLTKFLNKKMDHQRELEETHRGQKEVFDAQANVLREKELSVRELRRTHDEVLAEVNKITLSLSEVRSRLKRLEEQCLERHQKNLVEIFKDLENPELDIPQTENLVLELKDKLLKMGDVNTAALQEFEELKTRFEFLVAQKNDLQASLEALERAIQKINRTTKDRFFETFNLINERFSVLFPKLFKGGSAKLALTDETNMLETGVEIIAQPPGKKLQSISLLSGGEQAMTAISLIFSIFQIKPSPFCLLDEVDAPLDDANVGRYNNIVREMTHKTQFIVITHNKRTMELADTLYGVTMQEPGASQLVSVELH